MLRRSGQRDAAAVALQTIAYRSTSGHTSTGLWFLGSARHKDIAEDGMFVTALIAAVETTADRTGQRQQYLNLTELVKAVNEQFDAGGHGQRAELTSGLVPGLAPFLANSNYREELPSQGTDLQVQRRVAACNHTASHATRHRSAPASIRRPDDLRLTPSPVAMTPAPATAHQKDLHAPQHDHHGLRRGLVPDLKHALVAIPANVAPISESRSRPSQVTTRAGPLIGYPT
ncbi:hypothetical protein [Streptomyces virginiae]|uniref:hypothetical protein n=1 Tax=Streptomyces virginiae TaxID=1961 RepID=UPI0036CACD25